MKGVSRWELEGVVDGRRPVQNWRQYGSRRCGSNWIQATLSFVSGIGTVSTEDF